MPSIVAAVSEYERKLIGARTKAALAEKRAAGAVLGRLRSLDPAIADRIRGRRGDGLTLQAIADELNTDGVTTSTGRTWTAMHLRNPVTTWRLTTR